MQAVADRQEVFGHLGEEMVKTGLITADQLAVANVTLHSMGGNIGQVLIKKGFVAESQITNFLSNRLNIPIASIEKNKIDQNLVRIVPYTLAMKYTMIPLEKTGNQISLAIADPISLFSLDDIGNTLQSEVSVVLAPKEEVLEAIRKNYRKQEIRDVDSDEISVVKEDEEEKSDDQDISEVQEMASSVGAVSAANSIFLQAYKEMASDIHIEPQKDYVRVRMRIDGKLEERQILPKRMMLPVTSRIKVLSNMNIAERRAPQDGRIRLKISGKRLDLRTSILPSAFGEKVVIRLLRKDGLIKMENMGFSDRDISVFSEMITQPHGIILVTGPTGSGKSTTLYAALQKVNSIDRNIVSVEDPIESEIEGVNQSQVNIKAGLTFASALRSILRQDPDIIMIGEIRDAETAEMSLRAAMTGHLVFSTLHTNTALGAVPRLINLDIAPFLLSSSLLGVMAQRLVRRICSQCRASDKIDDSIRRSLGLKESDPVFKGAGCERCRNTGYSGRTGLFEIVPINNSMRSAIEKEANEDELLQMINKSETYISMKDDGREKVIQGLTTVSEVIRVTES